jgi:dTDP-4-dehydrorhamnose 3,5-epimerase
MLTFHETEISGVLVVETKPAVDGRGEFARTYDRAEFLRHGLDFVPVQISTSSNHLRGTLRGLHFQAPPRSEAKLVSCLRGSVFDVAVDLRPGSSSYGRWTGIELSGENRRCFYVPPGCAHGFQTLEDDTELLYLISEPYEAELQRGIRWDDPRLAIKWPATPKRTMSDRDRTLPFLTG